MSLRRCTCQDMSCPNCALMLALMSLGLSAWGLLPSLFAALPCAETGP